MVKYQFLKISNVSVKKMITLNFKIKQQNQIRQYLFTKHV